MAKTAAERVAAHRQRQVDQIESLRGQVADLESRLSRAEAENGRLRREVASLTAALEAETGEPEQAPARGCVPDHPADAIDNGRCTACGQWL